MKKRILTLMVAALLALPVAGLAMGMEHGSMKMDAAMIMLPMQTVGGISATVHLKDVKAMMGMMHTHHFMVTLEDQNGEELVPKIVAVFRHLLHVRTQQTILTNPARSLAETACGPS